MIYLGLGKIDQISIIVQVNYVFILFFVTQKYAHSSKSILYMFLFICTKTWYGLYSNDFYTSKAFFPIHGWVTNLVVIYYSIFFRSFISREN